MLFITCNVFVFIAVKTKSNSDFSPKSLLDLTLKTVNTNFKMLLCKLRKTLWSSLSSR